MPASPLVSTDWLAAHLGDPGLQIIDASWHMPGSGRDPAAEFLARHIPGARFFDIDRIADTGNPLPHMLPSEAAFADHMRRLGIGGDTMVVAYDVHGLMTAARAWWMLRLFGHDRVAILEGGLPKWLAESRPVAAGDAALPPAVQFTARLRPELLRDLAQMRATLDAGRQVVDARAADRFEGRAPEPRPGLPSGHMPGSRNLPWGDLIDPATKALLDPAAIRARFERAGIDLGEPLVASCGSGVSACVLALGAYLAGVETVAVYDGSWSEWASRPGAPIATGTPP